MWAVVLYRRPLVAGMLIGLASGTIYYPIFLLPLWCSFYWDRGVKRFLTGVLIAIGALVLTLCLTAGSIDGFVEHLTQMFGVRLPQRENLQGIWRGRILEPAVSTADPGGVHGAGDQLRRLAGAEAPGHADQLHARR